MSKRKKQLEKELKEAKELFKNAFDSFSILTLDINEFEEFMRPYDIKLKEIKKEYDKEVVKERT